mmetsp:Transcript_72767/g.146467  ORF Transcript_72767/g.146467 Transcript_72767/m.146467 type:complete len:213 (+) Transcript_72767:440-1078(+)
MERAPHIPQDGVVPHGVYDSRLHLLRRPFFVPRLGPTAIFEPDGDVKRNRPHTRAVDTISARATPVGGPAPSVGLELAYGGALRHESRRHEGKQPVEAVVQGSSEPLDFLFHAGEPCWKRCQVGSKHELEGEVSFELHAVDEEPHELLVREGATAVFREDEVGVKVGVWGGGEVLGRRWETIFPWPAVPDDAASVWKELILPNDEHLLLWER